MAIEDERVVEQRLHPLEGVEELNEPRVVIEECALRRLAESLAEFGKLRIGFFRSAARRDVQSRQRPDAVGAFGIAERLEVRGFEEGIREPSPRRCSRR